MTRKTMETKREAFGDDEAARRISAARCLAGDPQDEPEEDEDDDDDQEPDGRWVLSGTGCWTYE
jgi:hypothetical protein